MRHPATAKCYVVDTTEGIPRADYEAMFRSVRTGGRSFPSCDSTPLAPVRIRPLKSNIASFSSSYFPLVFDLATATTGIGLAVAMENPLPLLIADLQLSPVTRGSYGVEFTDTLRKAESKTLAVVEPAWFQKPEASTKDMLERSARVISFELFNLRQPLNERRWGRVALEPAALIVGAMGGDLQVGLHLEKFLPLNFSLHTAARAARYSDFDESYYDLWGGVRRYFLGDHARFFLGLEPYVAYERDYFLLQGERLRIVSALALVTFGYTWQGERIYTDLAFGYGPGYAWVEPNDIGVSGGTGGAMVGSLAVGFMF
jgi:hypothetical protein